ncbi:MAG: aspartate carbamoyltransferase [Oscillospiraceae bacterium]|jgi:aspartate carbamoyltransferase catalytic subunit|nr:aspartate carbamoyltransferase [Oscillospiraceae bacterium]
MKNTKERTKMYSHLIDLNDYSVEQWNEIIKLARDIKSNPHIYEGACTGKIMGTLFYEPSTRTQMSFQSAMLRLGGGIIGFDNPQTSSIAKGENLKDTTKTVSGYSDIMVMRHHLEGAAKAAALTADCPVVNAGDGGHLHPTQTLTDLLTLTAEKRLTDLNIGVCGDLKNGRTVHSLVRALSKYEGNKFTFISTKALGLPEYIRKELIEGGAECADVSSIEEALLDLDVLYMTRIQKERFASDEEYERQKDVFVLNARKLKAAKKDLAVLHPLPRVDEITHEVDGDPRALYFKQANYGMYARMALILIILNYDGFKPKPLFEGESGGLKCANKRCIVNNEKGLKQSFVGGSDVLVCEYCEERVI